MLDWLIVLSTRIPKFFPRKALISREGRSDNSGEWATTGTSIVMQIGGGQFRKRIYQSRPTPSTKILVMPQLSENILGEKMKNSIFRPKFDLFLGSSLPKHKDVSKNFHMTKRLML